MADSYVKCCFKTFSTVTTDILQLNDIQEKMMFRLFLIAMLISLNFGIPGCTNLSPIQIGATSKSKTINIPEGPVQLSINPQVNRLFIDCFRSKTITVVNIANGRLESTVEIGEYPLFIVFSYDGQYAFIGFSSHENQRYGGVIKLDTSLMEIVKKELIEKEFFPMSGVLSPDQNYLYVSNVNGSFLTTLDTTDLKIIKKIPLEEGGSVDMAISHDGTRLYVTHAFSSSVSIVDTKKALCSNVINEAGMIPVAISLSRDGDKAYVADNGDASITVIDTRSLSVADKIDTKLSFFQRMGKKSSFYPNARIFIKPNNKQLMLWNPYMSSPAIVHLSTKIATPAFKLTSKPSDILLDSKWNFFFWSDYENNTVTSIPLN